MAPIPKDWVQAYFESKIDRANRRIFLSGEIDSESANLVIQSLYYLSSENEQPIELIINSCGGCVYGTFAIVDTMYSLQCDVNTRAIGQCMSAAPLILSAGNRRTASKLGSGRPSDHKRDIKHSDRLDNMWCREMALRTSDMTEEVWESMCHQGDYYFGAEEALDFGLIDEIV